MIESKVMLARDSLVRQLVRTLVRTDFFPQDELAAVLRAGSVGIYERRIHTINKWPYELTRLPPTVMDEHAGQPPCWKLTRQDGSGLLVAGFTLYTKGMMDRGRRMHIEGKKRDTVERTTYLVAEGRRIVTLEEKILRLVDSTPAVELVEKEIERFARASYILNLLSDKNGLVDIHLSLDEVSKTPLCSVNSP